MRSFVFFLLITYLLAISLVCRVVSIYWLAIANHVLDPLAIWQVILIVILLALTPPLYYVMLKP